MKILKKIIICFWIMMLSSSVSIAIDADILNEQKNSLNISSFTKEAEKYTNEAFPDLDINELLNSAISGKVETGSIYKAILTILGKEIIVTIRTLGIILAIIVIHSILKSISDGLENRSVSEIVFFVQYLLIVALVLANFVEIVETTKNAIQNLITFCNSLVPILVTLLITTRKHSNSKCSATYNSFFNTIYWKFYFNSYNAFNYGSYSTWNSI